MFSPKLTTLAPCKWWSVQHKSTQEMRPSTDSTLSTVHKCTETKMMCNKIPHPVNDTSWMNVLQWKTQGLRFITHWQLNAHANKTYNVHVNHCTLLFSCCVYLYARYNVNPFNLLTCSLTWRNNINGYRACHFWVVSMRLISIYHSLTCLILFNNLYICCA